MFDTVKVEYPLPQYNHTDPFQTHSLGEEFAEYTITKEGILHKNDYDNTIIRTNHTGPLQLYNITISKEKPDISLAIWYEYNLELKNGIITNLTGGIKHTRIYLGIEP